MGNKKTKQHIVPRTYLKHWRIAEDKNFVYIVDFHNKHRTGVQEVGVNDKVFKIENYYNDNLFKNPYAVEDMLGSNFEPTYETIMNEIRQEQSLSESVRLNIINWLYISKARSQVMRDNPERMLNFMLKTNERWGGKELEYSKEKAIEEHARKAAKRIQLSMFSDMRQVQELLSLFVETLFAKHWRILKSSPILEFWTNDNPGFSPNVIERFTAMRPFHHVMEMNAGSIIYYPLSPKYCLEITPFVEGTPLDVSGATMEIKFEQASLPYMDYINSGVFHTRHHLVIANNSESLQRCIK
ncbi:MAG: DUF4238 domain-containing protein [Janthinobacterium lividum]